MKIKVKIVVGNNARVKRIILWREVFGLTLKEAKAFDDSNIENSFTDFAEVHLSCLVSDTQLGRLIALRREKEYAKIDVSIYTIDIYNRDNILDLSGGSYE
jgi:hypothetical protein